MDLIACFSLLGCHPDSKVVRINSSLQKVQFDIYIAHIYVVCRKLHFSRQSVDFASLNLHRFTCKAKQDSKSRLETTPGLGVFVGRVGSASPNFLSQSDIVRL